MQGTHKVIQMFCFCVHAGNNSDVTVSFDVVSNIPIAKKNFNLLLGGCQCRAISQSVVVLLITYSNSVSH